MRIFIVIPVKDESGHLETVLKDVSKFNLPTVVVDDGSSDASPLLLRKLGKKRNIRVLTHRVNLGKGSAMRTGAEYAFSKGAEAVIFMDSDGQHKASDIEKFEKALEEGHDVVFGSRNLSLGAPLVRYVGNKLASLLVASLFGIYVSDLVCGYRGLSRKAFKKVNWESQGYAVETEIAARTGKLKLKHCEVPVETVYYDSFKGVSIMDAFGVLLNTIKWRFQA